MKDDLVERKATIRDAIAVARELLKTNASDDESIVGGDTSSSVHTKTDVVVGDAVMALVREAFSSDSIVIEDAGCHVGQSEFTWLVDPIDGSLNRIRGSKDHTFGICLARAGEPLISGIWSEEFDAEFLSWSPDEVPSVPREQASPRIMGVGFSGNPKLADIEAANLRRLLEAGYAVRELGSTQSTLVRLLKGQLDGYLEYHLAAWDVAPVVPMMRGYALPLAFSLGSEDGARDAWIAVGDGVRFR